MCVTRPNMIHTSDMTVCDLYVQHDYMCDTALWNSYVWRDSMCDTITYGSYAWHQLFARHNQRWCIWVTSLRVWYDCHFFTTLFYHFLHHCIKHSRFKYTATHCDTLQHTATHCDTLRHTATHCTATLPKLNQDNTYTLQHWVTQSNAVQHTSLQYASLQHTATHCTATLPIT